MKNHLSGAVRNRAIISALFAVSALLLVCGNAFASTASLSPSGQLTYTAANNETNNATVSISGANVVLTDSGAFITSAPAACTRSNSNHTLTCPSGSVVWLTIRLYNQNDQFTNNTSTLGGDVYGGTGNDTLNGGNGTAYSEVLWGEDGNDTLNGRGDNDTLIAGAGNDSMDGGAGSDEFYGGTGTDTVKYTTRTNAVYVSLDMSQGPVGETQNNEYDEISDDGVERVEGGSGNDTLLGNDGGDYTNTLLGNGGNDSITAGADNAVLTGGGGADVITGGTGFTQLTGGEGNDTLIPGTGGSTTSGEGGNDLTYGGPASDNHYAGPGVDTISYADHSNPLLAILGVSVGDAVTGEYDSLNGNFATFVGGTAGDNIDATDGFAGGVNCNGGTDTATVEASDSVVNCETVIVQ